MRRGAAAERKRRPDRLIEAMASRNKEPKLMEFANARIPRFAEGYDWSEQSRVRTAMLAVLKTKSDEMWWRLREHAATSGTS